MAGLSNGGATGSISGAQTPIVSGGKQTTVSNRITQVSRNITPQNLGNNCVYFARSIAPDLPTGLFTLEDKVNKLLKNNKNKSDVPVPGAVGVMRTGEKAGHVYVVESVDYERGVKTIAETNWSSGKFGRRTLPIDDKNTLGYWVSPSLKKQNTTQPTPQISPKQVSNAVGNVSGLLQGNPSAAINFLTNFIKGRNTQPAAGGFLNIDAGKDYILDDF